MNAFSFDIFIFQICVFFLFCQSCLVSSNTIFLIRNQHRKNHQLKVESNISTIVDYTFFCICIHRARQCIHKSWMPITINIKPMTDVKEGQTIDVHRRLASSFYCKYQGNQSCATWAANWFSSRIKTGVPLFWPILRARDYYYHRQSLWLLIFIASQSINTFNTIIDWKHFSNERRIADNIDNNWYGINLWFTAANVCLTSYQNTFVTQKTRHISSRCACDADEQPRISSIFK